MKIYDDLTPTLRSALLLWTKGYCCWLSFQTSPEKLQALEARWIDEYGIKLPAWKRQDRKTKGLPNAVAIAAPVIGNPYAVEVLLLASEHATAMKQGPFSREKWTTEPLKLSRFELVHEPRDRGDYAWTWRINKRELALMERHLTDLVKTAPDSVAAQARSLVAFHPMFGGVRRQIRRSLNAARKLWDAMYKSTNWPGPDPEKLPMMIGFKPAPKKNVSNSELVETA